MHTGFAIMEAISFAFCECKFDLVINWVKVQNFVCTLYT